MPAQDKIIYFISGLGADRRAFSLLRLEGYTPVHLSWLPPAQGESISAYAARLSQAITTPDPIIIGLSFGGMVAVEIAHLMPVSRLILISSAATSGGLPFNNKLLRVWGVHRLLPYHWILKAYAVNYLLFGAKTKRQKKLMREILKDTDPRFFRWAMGQIIGWRNTRRPEQLIHIHGSQDKLLPCRLVNADITIAGGGHLMVLSHAAQISRHIQEILG